MIEEKIDTDETVYQFTKARIKLKTTGIKNYRIDIIKITPPTPR